MKLNFGNFSSANIKIDQPKLHSMPTNIISTISPSCAAVRICFSMKFFSHIRLHWEFTSIIFWSIWLKTRWIKSFHSEFLSTRLIFTSGFKIKIFSMRSIQNHPFIHWSRWFLGLFCGLDRVEFDRLDFWWNCLLLKLLILLVEIFIQRFD